MVSDLLLSLYSSWLTLLYVGGVVKKEEMIRKLKKKYALTYLVVEIFEYETRETRLKEL